jgi:hypothetical protein
MDDASSMRRCCKDDASLLLEFWENRYSAPDDGGDLSFSATTEYPVLSMRRAGINHASTSVSLPLRSSFVFPFRPSVFQLEGESVRSLALLSW